MAAPSLKLPNQKSLKQTKTWAQPPDVVDSRRYST